MHKSWAIAAERPSAERVDRRVVRTACPAFVAYRGSVRRCRDDRRDKEPGRGAGFLRRRAARGACPPPRFGPTPRRRPRTSSVRSCRRRSTLSTRSNALRAAFAATCVRSRRGSRRIRTSLEPTRQKGWAAAAVLQPPSPLQDLAARTSGELFRGSWPRRRRRAPPPGSRQGFVWCKRPKGCRELGADVISWRRG